MALMKNVILIAKNSNNLGIKIDGKQFKAGEATAANQYQIKKLMINAAAFFKIYEELEVDGVTYHIPLNIHNINKDNTDECVAQYAVGNKPVIEAPVKVVKPEPVVVAAPVVEEEPVVVAAPVVEEEPVVEEVEEVVEEEVVVTEEVVEEEPVQEEVPVQQPVQQQKQQPVQQQKKQFKQVKTHQQNYNKPKQQ